ncbi:S-layer homology domain-containing protein [Litorihabitans aurantiacus]|uniref:SLH domain-containing protein n=1 Tax=Litorihabitans aurantiacus TaxID=1930061 RepID=A0AA37UJE2_9MICO|nr:S-layer homology domain-containing protein [Litorihabitans aurantiacus]GMA30250.1 hypothetical protein GCM10025875_02420 [Litorihabitans aurantiacus]
MVRHRTLAPALVASLALTLTASVATVASAAPPDDPAPTPTVTAAPALDPAPATFTDVDPDTMFFEEITWLAGQRITTGWPDGTYRPLSPVNRDAMAAFLYRMENPGVPEPVCTEAPFPDVAIDNQFCGVISWLANTGITTGWPDGTFRPLEPINRDAMAAFLYRLADSPAFDAPSTSPFGDVTPEDQFFDEIAWVAATGVATGWPAGNDGRAVFRPVEPIARDAMAAFLYRLDDLGIIPVAIDGAIAAPGIGDPYYPESGNAGFDVLSYHVDLVWDPATRLLDAVTTLTASVTSEEKLGQFTLDLETVDSRGRETLTVSQAKVNGRTAGFTHADRGLDVVPLGGLEPGDVFVAQIAYSGTPGYVPDVYGDSGWHSLTGGGSLVMGEPASSSAWFPSNAHPSDKAFFSVTATVPYTAGTAESEQWQVSSNGEPVTGLPAAPEGWRTFGWSAPEPMATYLTTLFIDRFESTTTTTDSGVTIYNTFSPGVSQAVKDRAARTGEIQDFFEDYFGPYPFTTNGGQYTNDRLGYALETQTRSSYSANVGLGTIAHEVAHQWIGNDVGLAAWGDMCLNECLAEYAASWMWAEHDTGVDLAARYEQRLTSQLGSTSYWARPLVDMGAGNEFNDVYNRGSLAVHALRLEIGDDAFFTLLERWATEKSGQLVTFSDLEDMVDEVAGRDVSGFMTAWFRSTGVPAPEYRHLG